MELDTRAMLQVANVICHKDVYHPNYQGEVSKFSKALKEIETHKPRDAIVRSRAKWEKFGDKCSTKFSTLLDPKRKCYCRHLKT